MSDNILNLVITDSIYDWCLTDKENFKLLESYFEGLRKGEDVSEIEKQILEQVDPYMDHNLLMYDELLEANKFREGFEAAKTGLKQMGAGAKEYAKKSFDTAKTFGGAFKQSWQSTGGSSLKDRAKTFFTQKLPEYSEKAYTKAEKFARETSDRLGKAHAAGMTAVKQRQAAQQSSATPSGTTTSGA